MNLRTKTLGVMVVSLIVIIGGTYGVAHYIVMGGFSTLEQNEARDNLDRTKQALGVELSRLNRTTSDWSAWDDTYQFVQDHNAGYIDANLNDTTLTNLHINAMVFVNSFGEIMYTQAVDSNGAGVGLDESTKSAITKTTGLFNFTGPDDSRTGIVRTPSGALIVAARPIVTSSGEGPATGSLVMARWVDDALVTEFRDATKLGIVITTASSSLPDGVAPGEAVVQASGDSLTADTVLNDVDGAPALNIEVTMPRSIFDQGQTTLRYLLIWLLVLSAAFIALLVFMLDRTVLRPVARLSAFVGSVGTQLNSRAPVSGGDEIGKLGGSINGMLDSIERYSTALSGANEQLTAERQRVEEMNHLLEEKVTERTHELELTNAELRDRNRQLIISMRQATTDGLTGLRNYRRFQEDIRAAVAKPRDDRQMAVFMADIDRFKQVNDEYGHPTGDQILARVSDEFRSVLGEESVFRYGGDEFAMMVWVSSLKEAEDLAEDVRSRVAARLTDPPVTVSIGLALYSEASSPEELVYHADAAMYAAKAGGKNRVRVWSHGTAVLPATR